MYTSTEELNGQTNLIDPGSERNGACVVAETLRAIGATTVFCYPGGANLELLEAISRADIFLVRTEHEQGAVFAAQGYARASGRLGVCLATSGPGATNLVTGIADANSDSIPVMAITGNVSTNWLGKNAFQEADIVAIVGSITKFSKQVVDVDDLGPSIIHAATVALEGRPGPVLVDIPKDIQQAPCARASLPTITEIKGSAAGVPREVLDRIALVLINSRRPVIYAGGGVISAGMGVQLTKLAETIQCPVVLTLMGLGGMDLGHPLVLGPVGMHGAWCANVAVNEADLIVALGVRFDDRVIGDPKTFANGATIVHIDIDARELGKNRAVTIGVAADLRAALPQLLTIAKRVDTSDWLDYLSRADHEHPLLTKTQSGSDAISGSEVITELGRLLPSDAIVTTGVGQHQMWAMQHLRPRRPRSFLSSAGFGTMGFGLPAAIGAKIAVPRAVVVDVDGDGSLNMTINELSTCRRHRLGVKVLVMNNQWLGMVRQWQDLIYNRHRVATSLQDETSSGGVPYPDFVQIAAGYRINAERVQSRRNLVVALRRMIDDPHEPFVLDVIIEREANVLPMIPAGHSYRSVIFEEAVSLNIRET